MWGQIEDGKEANKDIQLYDWKTQRGRIKKPRDETSRVQVWPECQDVKENKVYKQMIVFSNQLILIDNWEPFQLSGGTKTRLLEFIGRKQKPN